MTTSSSPGSLLYIGSECVDICEGVRRGRLARRVRGGPLAGCVPFAGASPLMAPASWSAVRTTCPPVVRADWERVPGAPGTDALKLKLERRRRKVAEEFRIHAAIMKINNAMPAIARGTLTAYQGTSFSLCKAREHTHIFVLGLSGSVARVKSWAVSWSSGAACAGCQRRRRRKSWVRRAFPVKNVVFWCMSWA